MLTILEGPDGAGKTRFTSWYAKSIVHDHGPYPGEDQIAHHYWGTIETALKHNVVADRCWIAEPIYGRAFRDGGDRVGTASRRMLERGALAASAVVVLFLPPVDVCLTAFAGRPEEEYLDDAAQLREVYEGYLDLLRGTLPLALPYVVADWTRMSYSAVGAAVNRLRPQTNDGPGIGHWNPGKVVVLVGDRPGNAPTSETAPGFPFVRFDDGGCSAWFARQLEAAGVPESRLYWVNSHDAKDRPTPHEWLHRLRPAGVVALGRHAALWCRDAVPSGVEVVNVHHPQYWKRFHHGKPCPAALEAARLTRKIR